MKLNLVLALVLAAFLASCATTRVHGPVYSGGNGSSPQTAVVILGAKTDEEFRAAEAAWIGEKLPSSRVEGGSYVLGTGAHHAVKVLLADGSRSTVYFDMSGLGR